MNWHGKALGDKASSVVEHLKGLLQNPDAPNPKIEGPSGSAPDVSITDVKLSSPPNYKVGDALATRQAYGTALAKVCENNPRVIALDGDMKNSTFSQNVTKQFPERYVECFICEQNLVGVSWNNNGRDLGSTI